MIVKVEPSRTSIKRLNKNLRIQTRISHTTCSVPQCRLSTSRFRLSKSIVLSCFTTRHPRCCPREHTISTTVRCFTNYWGVTQNWCDLCWKLMASISLTRTSGISYGQAPLAKAISMKVSMSSKESITSHRVMKSQGRIDYATMLLRCRKGMDELSLISYQTHISYQVNSMISMRITKDWSRRSQREMYGLWSQPIHPRVKVSIWSKTSTSWMLTTPVSFPDTSLTLFWSMDTNSTSESTL